MLVAWIIGFVMNLIVFWLWRNSRDTGDGERIPINIILFIILVISTFVPILNIIEGFVFLTFFLVFYSEDDLEFRGPKWMTKEIK